MQTSNLLSCLTVAALLAATPAHARGPAPVAADSLINGSVPPGQIARSLHEERLSQGLDGQGNEMLVMRTTRAPGTRTPAHRHDFGGTTCVLEGEMTLFLEGAEPRRAPAGTCYYMPSGRSMVGANTGTVNAVMLDVFKVPVGQPVWTVVESGARELQDQFSAAQPHKH